MKLSLRGLRLRQGTFFLELDLEVRGNVIGIFGPSGAGKTSLIEMVAGLRKPFSGTVAIEEQIIVPPSSHQGFRVGYVPQDLALFPHFSVRQNIVYGFDRTKSRDGISVEHVTDILEIATLLDCSVAQLSGGQKQRVAFARALLASPQLLLMDEPLASLDHELKLKIVPYLKTIRDEFRIPMLYVSHSADEMAQLCDEIIVLHRGCCLCVKPPGEIFEPSTSTQLKPGIYDSSK